MSVQMIGQMDVRSLLVMCQNFESATEVPPFLEHCRLPVFQGSTAAYFSAMLSITSTETWACPEETNAGKITAKKQKITRHTIHKNK